MNTFAFAAYCHREDVQSNASKKSRRKKHFCWQCKKTFANKVNLNNHNLRYHENKRYGCTLCGKAFGLERDLKQHIQKHQNKKAFKCKLCEKAYSSLDKLNEHSIVHDQSKAHFECSFCGKEFYKQSIYHQHLQRHSTVFKCPECQKVLKSKYTYERHVRRHGGNPDIPCNMCERRYYDRDRLKQHQKKKHGYPPQANNTNLIGTGIPSAAPPPAAMVEAAQPRRQIVNPAAMKQLQPAQQLLDLGYPTQLHFL